MTNGQFLILSGSCVRKYSTIFHSKDQLPNQEIKWVLVEVLATVEEEGQIERQLISVIDSVLSQISVSTVIIILGQLRNTWHKGKGLEGGQFKSERGVSCP